MASGSIDKIGLINIIDNAFDEYYKKKDPNYESIDTIERNTTIFSFLETLYAIIKDGTLFDDKDLVETYRKALTNCQTKLRQIENRKIYQYNCDLAGSAGEADIKKNGLITLVRDLWPYADRNFPENLTENEQKYGYYETVNGEQVFNGYRENIIIASKLYPRYTNDEVDYSMYDLEITNKYGEKETIVANGSCIKIYGFKWQSKTISETGKPSVRYDAPYAEIYINGRLYGIYDRLKDLIGEDGYGGIIGLTAQQLESFYSQGSIASIMFVEYAFENGFVVNDMNEYESPNGVIYDLFTAALKSIDGDRNYLMDYLKEYFYHGIVERYRERKIEDRASALRVSTLDATYGTDVIPRVYETLSGKGGNIGGVQIIDFDRKVELGIAEYNRLMFDESYYMFDTNTIELYINKIYVNRLMKQLGDYENIDEYVKQLALRFTDLMDEEHLEYFNDIDEINELLLRSMFFAVEPFFQPSDMSKFPFNSRFFINNVPNFQKVYFYNKESAFKEDNILKNLTAAEDSGKSWSATKRGVNISLKYDTDNMIIVLHNDEDIVVDSSVFTHDSSGKITEEVSQKNYLKKLNDKYGTGKVYLGNGYINIGKVPQKFKDNSVSRLIDNEDTNKNSFFESTEFASAFDDREIAVVHGSRGGLFTREVFENNVTRREEVAEEYSVFVNEKGQYTTGVYGKRREVGTDGKLVVDDSIDLYREVRMPNWKKAKLTRGEYFFELECTDFAKHNDIGSIAQIRVMDATNALDRWLFNVRSVEKRRATYEYKYFDLNIEDLSKYDMTYILNNVVYFPNRFASAGGDTLTYLRNAEENISISTENIIVEDEVSGKKYDVDTSVIITVPDEVLGGKTYVFGDELIFPDLSSSPSLQLNKDSDIFVNNKNETYTLVIDDSEKTEILYEFKYYLILEEAYGNSFYNHTEPLEVLIMQFVQMDGRPNRVELPQVNYIVDKISNKVIASDFKVPRQIESLSPTRLKNDPKIKAVFSRGNFMLAYNHMLTFIPNDLTIRTKREKPSVNFKGAIKLRNIALIIDKTNRSGRYMLFQKSNYRTFGNFYMRQANYLRFLYEGDENKRINKQVELSGFNKDSLVLHKALSEFLKGETMLGLVYEEIRKNIEAETNKDLPDDEFLTFFVYSAFRLFHRKYGYYQPATNQYPYDESKGPDRRVKFETELKVTDMWIESMLFKEIIETVDKENERIYKINEIKNKATRTRFSGKDVELESSKEEAEYTINKLTEKEKPKKGELDGIEKEIKVKADVEFGLMERFPHDDSSGEIDSSVEEFDDGTDNLSKEEIDNLLGKGTDGSDDIFEDDEINEEMLNNSSDDETPEDGLSDES